MNGKRVEAPDKLQPVGVRLAVEPDDGREQQKGNCNHECCEPGHARRAAFRSQPGGDPAQINRCDHARSPFTTLAGTGLVSF